MSHEDAPVRKRLNKDAEEFIPRKAAAPVASQGPAAEEASDAASQEEDEDEDVGEQRIPLAANRQLDPLEVRFSQFRARSRFRDGKLLADTEEMLRAVPITPGAASSSAAGDGALADKEKDISNAEFSIETPFPPIQVLQWRCKLRDAQGRPRIDPKTGGEFYDNEDRWFTLDNRRLCCLQKAAIKAWPKRCVVDVVELPPGPLTRTRTRQLKKFRTFDRGKTILIGERKEADDSVKWSWREKVGQEADAEEADIKNAHVQMRRRRRENERGTDRRDRGDAHRRRLGGVKDEEPEGGFFSSWTTSWRGIFMFFFIYLCLRILAKVAHGIYLKMQASPG